MRRAAALLLALILSLSLLAGCGDSGGDSSSAGGSSSSSSESASRSGGFSSSGSSGAGSSSSSSASSSGEESSSPPESSSETGASSSAPAGSTGTATAPAAPAVVPSGTGTGTGPASSGTGSAASSAPAPSNPGTGAAASPAPAPADPAPAVTPEPPQNTGGTFDLSMVPAYAGNAYEAVNGNVPFFDTSSIAPVSVENYSPLDSLGRCGTAYACVGQDIMPTEDRGSIGMVKPTGWHTVKYDIVDGKYLYNRCHLIGYQLSAENANERNLITGTRYLNIEGMLPFENLTADYVKETNGHVAYRVTPVFSGSELVARGVLMEGWSVEDRGDGVCFCVFAYNVQPGVTIDYATGDSALSGEPVTPSQGGGTGTGTGTGTGGGGNTEPAPPASEPVTPPAADPAPQGTDYIYNKNTKKFHYPSCSSVDSMKESNKGYFTGTRDELISMGYEPCKRCNP